MKLTRDEYTISLDAHFDLVMAGLPCEEDDCESFEQEYKDAAAEIAEERGRHDLHLECSRLRLRVRPSCRS